MSRLTLDRPGDIHAAVRARRPGRARAHVKVGAKRVRPALTPLDGGRGSRSTGGDVDPGPSTSSAPSTDWTTLALSGGDDDTDAASDADFAAAVNDLATTAARAILSGNEADLRPGTAWHAEVSSLGDFCTRKARAGGVDQGPSSPWFQGALLSFLLLEVASGRWPTPQADALSGPFRDAAVRLHGLLENSGWKLVRPEDEDEEGG